MKQVILINGLKRSGKDTYAKCLKRKIEDVGLNVAVMHFATPLKQAVATQYGISLAMLEGLKNEETEIVYKYKNNTYKTNFRKLLQKTGDAIKELTQNPNIFGDLLFEKHITPSSSDVILVPDFRFVGENDSAKCYQTDLDDIKLYEVSTVKILNDNCKTVDAHPSETELTDKEFRFDWQVVNDGKTMSMLEKQALCMTNVIVEKYREEF